MGALLSMLVLLVLMVCNCNAPGAWAQAVADPDIFLNINCGYSTDILDPLTNLTWYGDDKYISTGFTSSNVKNYPWFPQLNTLRYFNDTRIPKYCYQMPVVPLSTYMLRTEFYYASYDNLNSLPTFQMTIDGLIVANISNTKDSAFYIEYTYQAQGNATFLCLLRDSSKTNPFISTISLRRVKPYPTLSSKHLSKGYIAKTRHRYSFGATSGPRYPKDIYDRYWNSVNETTPEILNSTSPLTALHTTRSLRYAPSNPDYDMMTMMVLQSGLTSTGSMTLTLHHWVGNKAGFLILHFAELDPSVNISSRVFTVKPSSRNSFATVDIRNRTGLDGFGWFWDNLVFADSYTETVELAPAPGSLYGPLINACEFFEIIPQVAPVKTINEDLMAIEHIKSSLKLGDWTGDPCLPVPHTWVNCSSLSPPTIDSVNLSNFNLSGIIPVEFNELPKITTLILSSNNFDGLLSDLSLLKNLRILHLQDNNLSGELPAWLGQLPLLVELNVQNNNFSGTIPPGLLSKNGLVFTYQPGNPLLKNVTAQDITAATKNSTNIGVIVGSILGAGIAALAAAILFFYCCVYKKRKSRENLPVTTPSTGKTPAVALADSRAPNAGGARPFSVAALATATQNFNREIGKGGFGPVYYGKLPKGQEVAVKVLDSTTSNQGASEFFNEVDVLSKVHHRNLVSLLGFCNEGENRMLVYEYMPQGSLRDRLNASAHLGVLDFKARLNIALNAAQGLDYLHTGCNPGIVHRDVKSTNILLTGSTKDAAKVGDFGLSRLAQGEGGSLTFVKGTRGYIDPEYVNSQILSTKSDVFSFGVVLLELLTGQLPLQSSQNLEANHGWTLCDWVRTTLLGGSGVDQILDPELKACRPNMEAMWAVADIAMRCVEPKSVHRPTMAEVIQELRAAVGLEEGKTGSDDPSANFTRRVQLSPSTDYNSGGFSSSGMSWPAPR
ncbi:hypothetical protein KC19_1G185300 [Ceratodon purpureus]|uniref:non-specific serine/threonine protein kinase n=1 Tax=Ceratodon purpureus TaxID=3225 RepID=A0A8T0J9E3_CERPU|nr:hypothetical protein KC19_1G185300 [Ceratodon purpureus]